MVEYDHLITKKQLKPDDDFDSVIRECSKYEVSESFSFCFFFVVVLAIYTHISIFLSLFPQHAILTLVSLYYSTDPTCWRVGDEGYQGEPDYSDHAQRLLPL